MEKLIIIEGNDNSGKDTLINNLKKYYLDKSLEEFHCSAPISNNPIISKYEQYSTFINLAINSINSDKDIVIHNRSWYGEYVYGVKYRNRNKEDVLSDIAKFEEIIKRIQDKVYYIQLISEAKILKDNEDGLSLSNGNIDKIKDEIKAFKEVFKHSTLKNKKIINVTKKGEWKSREDILKEVLKFIEQ